MTVRGVFSGLLALTVLQAVLSSTQSAERTAGIWSAVTSGVARFMSPTVAAIPDIRDRSKWDTVAPGDPGKVPYSSDSSGSTTMPADWTTKPAPPRSLAV
ncbi:hypothetical protein ABZ341_41720 [Streptomyces sp. NPDC006173]|uniref:hypothetical protein n=1 Tax=Streptomyces sp. NPDC006173 TaxID=3155349 RepID=UPI0033DF4674